MTRDIAGKDDRLYRAMNITVPIEIWQTINDQKHIRRSTYAEVIAHAIEQTYGGKDTTNDDK